MKRILGILFIVALGVAFIVQCAPKNSFVYEDAQPISWRVGLSFPSSSIEVIDRSTIGRWSTIVDQIKSDLISHGFSENNIIVRQTDRRTTQVEQVDELIQKEKVDELVVVPVDFTREELVAFDSDPTDDYHRAQYAKLKAKAEQTGDATLIEGVKEPAPKKEPSESYLKDLAKLREDIDARTLEQSLNEAKQAGTYLVGVGTNTLSNFPFDYFVSTPSPEDVANVQAGYAVAHLGLPELQEDGSAPALSEGELLASQQAASTDLSKPAPATPDDAPTGTPSDSSSAVAGSAGDGSSDSETSTGSASAEKVYWPKNVEVMALDAVRPESKRYFTQFLKRMKPYFEAGYLHANSGLVTKDSTDEDYIGVAITEDGDKSAGIMHNILDKFYKQNDPAHKLSLIFAQHDALSRGAVRALVEASWSPGDAHWPIVTGFGSEKITVSDIVEGKQAMSIAYDSKVMAVAISQMLNNHALQLPPLSESNLSGNQALSEAASSELEGSTIYFSDYGDGDRVTPLLVMRPVTISADNLKDFLVNKGYVSPADAGL